jgi:hypothetical protein
MHYTSRVDSIVVRIVFRSSIWDVTSTPVYEGYQIGSHPHRIYECVRQAAPQLYLQV